MKFSTMLLPTGEFVILIGELTTPPGPDVLQAIKEETGAAAVFGSMDATTGTDALYDEHAVRRDPDPIQTLLDAGANFTPAGLVDHRSLSEIVEQDVLGQDARTRQQGLVAGVQRSPEHHFPDPPTGHAEVDDAEPYSPSVGDRVKITGLSFMGSDRIGQVGEVVSVAGPWGEAPIVVRFSKRNGPGGAMTANYNPADLEPAADEPYEPQPGDRVRLTGTSLLGSEVDQLVGIVDDNPNAARGGFWVTTDGGNAYLVTTNQMELISRG